MFGGDGSDTFAFEDRDTGDVSWGLADSIGDFDSEDILDLSATRILYFAGYDVVEPERGGLSIWQADGNAYVTWNTFGSFHDVELTGFSGDYYNLLNQIHWYEDDYAASVFTTGVITPGDTVQGTIERSVDQDWFRIDLQAGQLYDFDLQGVADGGGTLVDPYLVLLDEAGGYVADGYERLVHLADSDGTFFIAAQSFGDVGTYTLTVTSRAYVDDFGDDTTTNGQIAAGDSVTGEIGVPYDEDWFRIDLQAGQLYDFDLQGVADGGGTLVDPYLVLLDEAGGYVAEGYERLVHLADSDGTFFIAAQSFGDVGTYTLTVTAGAYVDDFGGDIASAGRIAPGETLTGLIGVPNDEDWFAIDLDQGETYVIDLRGQSSGVGSLPDPLLLLLDGAGNGRRERRRRRAGFADRPHCGKRRDILHRGPRTRRGRG